MKNFLTSSALAICILGTVIPAYAGNKDRSGQSGASELEINPWGQSTGIFGMNIASVGSIEALKTNIAGLADVQKTDIGLSHVIYLTNSQVTINNLAIAQKVGSSSVIGLNVMSMGFGDITVTDYNNPEGSGTYRPQFLNFQLGFAKEFSNSVRAGLAATFVSEQLTSIHANGACFDAGIQYKTGKRDNFHFGITLRNVGTNMRFTGSGFSINGESPNSNYKITEEMKTDKFALPTYLSIGMSYDFFLDEKHLKDPVNDKPKQRLSLIAAFTSNSFNNDYLGGGLEYAYMETIMLRAGYRYENGIGTVSSTTMYNGFCAGVTAQKQMGDKGPLLAIDYSFRPTVRPANGVHVISLRFMRR